MSYNKCKLSRRKEMISVKQSKQLDQADKALIQLNKELEAFFKQRKIPNFTKSYTYFAIRGHLFVMQKELGKSLIGVFISNSELKLDKSFIFKSLEFERLFTFLSGLELKYVFSESTFQFIPQFYKNVVNATYEPIDYSKLMQRLIREWQLNSIEELEIYILQSGEIDIKKQKEKKSVLISTKPTQIEIDFESILPE